jgi:gluconate 2-dehydrogenase alpha chain
MKKSDLPTLQPVGNRSLSNFDVLVIGSGAGGGAATHVLTANGLKVLVLEAGPNFFTGLDDPTQPPSTLFSNDEVKLGARWFITPDPVAEPRTWRTDESVDHSLVGDIQALPKTVGGGAAHADLKMPRFMPQDFHLGTELGAVSGASFADWPVDYAALELFYAYAEKVLGVQGKAGAFPQEGPRSGAFPMPPGLQAYFSSLVAGGLTKLGYTAFPYPSAINSQPYGGRPACSDCGFCSGFGCPSGAKGSPPVTTLRRALLSGNCLLVPGTRAVQLLMNGNSVAGVMAIDPDGNRVMYTADRYVLAASPIEDARLLFLSDPGGAGVGNSSGQVGRNLTFHLQTQAIGILEQRHHGHRSRAVDTGFGDFRGTPNDPNHPLGGIVEISAGEGPLGEAQFYSRAMKIVGFDGARLKKLMRQSPGRDRAIALVLQAEDAPQATNRVDLDPSVVDLDGLPVARVTYKNHPFELSARDFYSPKLLDILGASGCKWAAIAPFDDIPGSAHIMGTLRFGNDPASSVCDADGRFHDVGNLYAADGSLFPTSSGFNPTMTIVALAMRVAGAMVFPGMPERALVNP